MFPNFKLFLFAWTPGRGVKAYILKISFSEMLKGMLTTDICLAEQSSTTEFSYQCLQKSEPILLPLILHHLPISEVSPAEGLKGKIEKKSSMKLLPSHPLPARRANFAKYSSFNKESKLSNWARTGNACLWNRLRVACPEHFALSSRKRMSASFMTQNSGKEEWSEQYITVLWKFKWIRMVESLTIKNTWMGDGC